MAKIIQYGTIAAYDTPQLADAVDRGIKQGWQPFGSPVYCPNLQSPEGKSILWLQAMVRYEEKKEA